jgi:hypothetical protein
MIMSRKKKFKRILLCALLISLPFFQSLKGNTNDVNDNKEVAMCITNDTMNLDTVVFGQLIKDSIKNELIDEAENYIFKNYPKAHKNVPMLIVENGLEHDIDILFMMAQTQIETCYGTTGAGRESSRRSMFGVIKRHYPTYEVAINHYCEVLKKYYLVKGRTEQHLLTKYVTGTGGRYAGNPNYETELRIAYNHIKRTTNVYSLQQEWNKF